VALHKPAPQEARGKPGLSDVEAEAVPVVLEVVAAVAAARLEQAARAAPVAKAQMVQ
jgi:hypothetical protein